MHPKGCPKICQVLNWTNASQRDALKFIKSKKWMDTSQEMPRNIQVLRVKGHDPKWMDASQGIPRHVYKSLG